MSKRTDKDGLYQRKGSSYWRVSFIDQSGKRTRRSTGITHRKEAEALFAKWKLDSHRAEHWGEQQRHSFEELMVAYLTSTAAEKRSHERDLYSTKHLNRFSARCLSCLEARTFAAARIPAHSSRSRAAAFERVTSICENRMYLDHRGSDTPLPPPGPTPASLSRNAESCPLPLRAPRHSPRLMRLPMARRRR